MNKPSFIQPNSTIGIISLSAAPCIEPYKTRYLNAIKKFEELGYNLIFASSVLSSQKLRSNTATQRAAEFTDMYLNDSIDAIFATSGGEFMMEILPYINFEKLKQSKPKWFIGFSDNTCLTFTLTTLCDAMSLYGPCFSEYGMNVWDKSLQDNYNVLLGNKTEFNGYAMHEISSTKKLAGHFLDAYNLTEKNECKILSAHKEIFENGILIGGCMDILSILLGTKFGNIESFLEKYKNEGFIWFLESCDLTIAGQTQVLWQLKNAGWFKYAKAVLIGRAKNKEPFADLTYEDCNFTSLADLEIPILIDVDFGHVPPALPMVTGAKVEVSFFNQIFNLNYKFN